MGRAVVSGVLLDTHAFVWLMEGDASLGSDAREMADAAARNESLLVSAISFWEVAMLARRNRLTLVQSPSVWRRSVLELGVIEVAVSGDIGILATELEGLPPDPADRIIVATGLRQAATLITADTALLDWPGHAGVHDARR